MYRRGSRVLSIWKSNLIRMKRMTMHRINHLIDQLQINCQFYHEPMTLYIDIWITFMDLLLQFNPIWIQYRYGYGWNVNSVIYFFCTFVLCTIQQYSLHANPYVCENVCAFVRWKITCFFGYSIQPNTKCGHWFWRTEFVKNENQKW